MSICRNISSCQPDWNSAGGQIDLVIGGIKSTYRKADRIFYSGRSKAFGKIYAGYADITFFMKKIDISRSDPYFE